MKIEYDEQVDAAYIYLVDQIGAGGVERTLSVDPREIQGQINLDFDSEGKLIGVEILDATRFLREETLRKGTR